MNNFRNIFSQYCGLGGEGIPRHELDRLCREHDLNYQSIIEEQGYHAAYGIWNWADEQFLEDLVNVTPEDLKQEILNVGIHIFTTSKKNLAPHSDDLEHRHYETDDTASESSLLNLPDYEEEETEEEDMSTRSGRSYAITRRHDGTRITHRDAATQTSTAVEQEEGAEAQADVPYSAPIWSKFPNTQTTKLSWVQTLFIGGGASRPLNEPFDQPDQLTATSLLTTGGGALSTPTFANLLPTTVGYQFDTPALFQLRMTTPYNILKQAPAVANNLAASTANWTTLWDQKYQYYHTLECTWSITINMGYPNDGTNSLAGGQLLKYYVFYRYTSQDEPPTTQTFSTNSIANQTNLPFTGGATGITSQQMTNSLGAVNLTPDDYLRMGGWHHEIITLNTTHGASKTITGSYKYGQCKMDMKTMSTSDAHGSSVTAESWSQSYATPGFPEVLSMIIVQDNAITNAAGTTTPCSVRMQTDHIVQWKDLRGTYKFPLNAYATQLPNVLDTDINFFSKGAAYT